MEHPLITNFSMRSSKVISTNWPDPDVSAAGRVASQRLQMLRGWLGEEVGAPLSGVIRSMACWKMDHRSG